MTDEPDESWRDMLHADLAEGRARKEAARGQRSDPAYHTQWWRKRSKECLERDNYKCAARNCPERASEADHIVPRKDGGSDELSNLRSLCKFHHAQVQPIDGKPGKLRHIANLDGSPSDPSHPWYRGPK